MIYADAKKEPATPIEQPKEESKVDTKMLEAEGFTEIIEPKQQEMNVSEKANSSNDYQVPDGIPKSLADLMKEKEVTELEIQEVVAKKKYFPKDTPIRNYPPDFIEGVLVQAWPQVFAMIDETRVPF